MNESVKLVWITPDAEKHIAYMARVSNPDNQDNPSSEKLVAYLIKNAHWSPFEMINVCMELNTTRDIGRQIIRHRSFAFQEFSQRYADASLLGDMVERECRMQDAKNRQNSLECDDKTIDMDFHVAQQVVWQTASKAYQDALSAGVAKEQARALLPEGLTPSRMYMNGTLRSWLHYIDIRTDKATQKEHRLIAQDCEAILREQLPAVMKAFKASKEVK